MDIKTAERNIKLKNWIHLFMGIAFLTPVITLLYKYTGLSLAEIILVSNIGLITVRWLELPTSVFADTTWRKKSLVIAGVCSLLWSLVILLFPSFTGFIIAAIFGWLFGSFWSGTIQAFTEENLRAIGKEHEFGKRTWNFMALVGIGWIITPFIAAWLLKLYWDNAYHILAWLDVVSSFIMLLLLIQLKEPNVIEKIDWFKKLMIKNIEIAKSAFKNVFGNKKLRSLLLYRTFATHISFLSLISLPVMVDTWMPEWIGWIVVAIAWLVMLIANKYAYKIWDKKGYNITWMYMTIAQWIILIITGFILKSWIMIAAILIIFNIFDWIRQVVWSHVLVEQSKGVAIATTRSVIISVTALYIAFWRQILSVIPLKYALIWSGAFILIVNILMAKNVLALKKE